MIAILNGYIARMISTFNVPSKFTSIHIVIADSLSIVCYYLFLFFCITNSWLIYYKERWTFYTLQSKWANIITSNDEAKQNWFIRNNHRYGSISYMMKLFGTYHIFATVAGTIAVIGLHLRFIDKSITDILAALPFLIAIVIYTTIICKTNRLSTVDDVFYIHWESKVHSKILLIFLIIYLLHAAMEIIMDQITATIISTPLFLVITYSIHHVSTYLVYKKNYPHNFRTQSDNDLSQSSETIPTGSNSSGSTKIEMHLQLRVTFNFQGIYK